MDESKKYKVATICNGEQCDIREFDNATECAVMYNKLNAIMPYRIFIDDQMLKVYEAEDFCRKYLTRKQIILERFI